MCACDCSSSRQQPSYNCLPACPPVLLALLPARLPTCAAGPAACQRLLLQGLNLNAIWSSPVSVNSYGGYHGWVWRQPEPHAVPPCAPVLAALLSSPVTFLHAHHQLSALIAPNHRCPILPRVPPNVLLSNAEGTGPSTCMPSMGSLVLPKICSTCWRSWRSKVGGAACRAGPQCASCACCV